MPWWGALPEQQGAAHSSSQGGWADGSASVVLWVEEGEVLSQYWNTISNDGWTD